MAVISIKTSLAAACALSTTAAWKVDFWGESNCAGPDVGEWVGGPDQGCQTLFVGEASGAVATSTGSVDDNSSVIFYSSDDCNISNAIAETNSDSCITVDGPAGSYQSFNVLPDGSGDRKLAARNVAAHRQLKHEKALLRRQITMEERKALDTETAANHAMAKVHGEVSDFDGRTWKWHQVAHATWRGIPLNEWDDAIHVKNDTFLEYSETYPFDFSTQSPNPASPDIVERQFLPAVCRAYNACTQAAVGGTAYVIANIATPAVNKIAQACGTTSIWGCLNNPFVAAVSSGALGGVVGAVTQARIQASSCSDSNSDTDAIQSVLQEQGRTLKALQESITDLNNVLGKLSFIAEPDSQRSTDTCGAPNPDPSG